MKSIFIFFILLSVFSQPNNESLTKYDNLRIVENPDKSTASNIPRAFIPEKSNLIQFFELDIFSTESGLFLTTENNFEILEKFYEEAFKANDWKIFRKDKRENLVLFQVENGSKRIYSILIRKFGSLSKIKIFYKRAR